MVPLLIAKQKGAKVAKDDYKLGWLYRDETGYLWVVWGSSRSLDNAKVAARQLLAEKGQRTVYLSETPMECGKPVCAPLPALRELFAHD